MTQDIKDVLNLALDALDNLVYWDNGRPDYDDAREAITAVKKALREHAMREVQRLGQEIEQEPVDCEKLALLGWQAVECSICGSSAKAFTKPKQEPVGINGLTKAEEDATASVRGLINTTPPQRTWAGLTDEEIAQGCKESWVTEQAWQSAVWWAEAKLKEKNT